MLLGWVRVDWVLWIVCVGLWVIGLIGLWFDWVFNWLMVTVQLGLCSRFQAVCLTLYTQFETISFFSYYDLLPLVLQADFLDELSP